MVRRLVSTRRLQALCRRKSRDPAGRDGPRHSRRQLLAQEQTRISLRNAPRKHASVYKHPFDWHPVRVRQESRTNVAMLRARICPMLSILATNVYYSERRKARGAVGNGGEAKAALRGARPGRQSRLRAPHRH